MPATLIKSPPPIAFSLNPIEVKIQGSNWLSVAGVKAVDTLTVSGAVAAGATVNIKYGSNDLTFTAAAAPNDSGLQFISGNGSAAYVGTLLAYFQNNFILNRDFVITHSGQTLIFTARETGNLFNFSAATAGSIALTLTTAGVMQAVQPNYGNFVELWLERVDGSGFEKIHEKKIELDYPYTGISSYCVEGILHSHLEMELPDVTVTEMVRCNLSRRRYYLRVAESYGAIPTVKKLATSDVYTVILGGLSFQGNVGDTTFSFLNPAPLDASQIRFLKQDRRRKIVLRYQPEFIYYLAFAAHATLTMVVKYYFTDGTAALAYKTLNGVSAYSKIQVPATFSRIYQADLHPGKFVGKYEIWLEAASVKVSETRTYIIDYKREQYDRYFGYKSSLGTLDTIRTYGKGSNEISINQQSAEYPVKAEYTLAKGQRKNYAVELQDTYQVNTGWMDRYQLTLMRDFYVSDEKYRITQGKYLPVSLTSKKISELADGQGRLAQAFEYEYQFTDHAYTEGDEEILGSVNIPQNLPDPLPVDMATYQSNEHTDYYLSGPLNGVNKIFYSTQVYQPLSTKLYRNGIRQYRGVDYTETGPNEITLILAPYGDEDLYMDYLLTV